METERLIELLNLLKTEFTNRVSSDQTGLCKEISLLYRNGKITLREKQILKIYLENNKPTPDNQYSDFTYQRYWIDSSYWWYAITVGVPILKKVRIEYLERLIANVK